MTNNYLDALFGLMAGVCLGIIFFGGLWITTNRLNNFRNSGLWLVVSYFGRTTVCLLGFYLILYFTHSVGLIAGLAGFIATQFLLVRYLSKRKEVR